MHNQLTHYGFEAIDDACTGGGESIVPHNYGLYPAIRAGISLSKSKALQQGRAEILEPSQRKFPQVDSYVIMCKRLHRLAESHSDNQTYNILIPTQDFF